MLNARRNIGALVTLVKAVWLSTFCLETFQEMKQELVWAAITVQREYHKLHSKEAVPHAL